MVESYQGLSKSVDASAPSTFRNGRTRSIALGIDMYAVFPLGILEELVAWCPRRSRLVTKLELAPVIQWTPRIDTF